MKKAVLLAVMTAITLSALSCLATQKSLSDSRSSICSNYKKLNDLVDQGDASAMNTLAFCLLSMDDPPCKELEKDLNKRPITSNQISERIQMIGQCIRGSQRESIKTALLLLQKAAELGNTDAQYNFDAALSKYGGMVLGIATSSGYEGEKKAAEKGHPYALLDINKFSLEKKQSMAVIEKLSNEGFAEAQLVMAGALFRGDGVKEDREKAQKLYRMYKKQGPFISSPHAIFPALDAWWVARIEGELRAHDACETYKDLALPVADQPSPQARRRLKCERGDGGSVDCQSVNFYFGAGRPKDAVQARHAAWIEMGNSSGISFGGADILIMIYANGFGVTKNIDAALHLACNEANPNVVNHLLDMKEGRKKSDSPYDICEDAMSRDEITVCTGRGTRIATAKREHLKKQLTQKWSAKAKAALKELDEAAGEFFENIESEDSRGSGRLTHVYAEVDRRDNEDAHLALLVQASENQLPSFSQKQFLAADRELNRAYHKLRKLIANVNCEEVNCSDLPDLENTVTQKNWLRYRDAWDKLVKIQFPTISPFSIKTLLTKQRTEWFMQEAEELKN